MCYIETAVNSIRISFKVKKTSGVEELLTHIYERFISLRADKFDIVRRRPAHEGYDITFLITEKHLEDYKKEEVINFMIEFILGMEKDIYDIRMMINKKSRDAAELFTKGISG